MIGQLPLLWLQFEIMHDMAANMNTSANPCEDFYNFACGNYRTYRYLTEHQDFLDPFSSTDNAILDQLRDWLDDPEEPTDTRAMSLVKNYYMSCINIEKREQLGNKPLLDILQQFGGWPIVDGQNWKENEYDYIKIDAKMTVGFGGNHVIRIMTFMDPRNTSNFMLAVAKPSLGLQGPEFYGGGPHINMLAAYRQYIIDSAIALGAAPERAILEADQLLILEMTFAKEILISRRRGNDTSEFTTKRQLIRNFPEINFSAWFNILAGAGVNVSDDDEILIFDTELMRRMVEILLTTAPRTIANFQLWGVVRSGNSLLPPSKREHQNRFSKLAYGLDPQPLWKNCLGRTTGLMSLPVGALYVRKVFDDSAIERIQKMIDNLRAIMESTIDDLVWMDDETKENAKNKLNYTLQQVAYPLHDLFNDTWVMREFVDGNRDQGYTSYLAPSVDSQAIVSEDDYFSTHVSVVSSSTKKHIRDFSAPINRSEWTASIAQANAFYARFTNVMVLPAGILRLPFFHPSAPDYVNYGRIGEIVGHEITHGFDSQGSQRDELGNFRGWWSNETWIEFITRARCFVKAYSSVLDLETGMYLNGMNTLPENIADAGGVKLSYKAFQISRRKGHDAVTVPPSIEPAVLRNYAPDQLFFISFGQAYCRLIRPEIRKVLIITDEHTPPEHRINVALRNNPDFAKVFNCPIGSYMNPKEKCELW